MEYKQTLEVKNNHVLIRPREDERVYPESWCQNNLFEEDRKFLSGREVHYSI